MAEYNEPKKPSSENSKKLTIKDDSEIPSPVLVRPKAENNPASQAVGTSTVTFDAAGTSTGARPKEFKHNEDKSLSKKEDSKSSRKDEVAIPMIPPPPPSQRPRRQRDRVSQSHRVSVTSSSFEDAASSTAKFKGGAGIQDSLGSETQRTSDYEFPTPPRELTVQQDTRGDEKVSDALQSEEPTIAQSKSLPNGDKESKALPRKGLLTTLYRKAKSMLFKKETELIETPQDSTQVGKNVTFVPFPDAPYDPIPAEVCDFLKQEEKVVEDGTSVETYVYGSDYSEKCSDSDSDSQSDQEYGESDDVAISADSRKYQPKVKPREDVDDASSDVISNPDSELGDNLERKTDDYAMAANVRESGVLRTDDLRFIDSTPDKRTVSEMFEGSNELETKLFRINVASPVDITVNYASSRDTNYIRTSIRYDIPQSSPITE